MGIFRRNRRAQRDHRYNTVRDNGDFRAEAAVEAGPWVFRILRGVVRGIGHLGD